jgi:hypothetical protein
MIFNSSDEYEGHVNKTPVLIGRTHSFLVISIVFLFVAYFAFPHYVQDLLPLPLFIEAKRLYMYVLAIGFFILILIPLGTRYPLSIRMALSTLAIPFCCVFSYLWIDTPKQILASTNFNNHRYHITVEGNFDETYVTYMIYKCDIDDFKCQELYYDYSGGIDSVDFVIDKKMNELHAIFNGVMKYTDGNYPREIIESEEYNGYIYSVAILPVDVYSIYGDSNQQYVYSLYRCNTFFRDCEKLPFRYTDDGGAFQLTVNESTNELEMYHWKGSTSRGLIYSYSKEARCYVERCSIPDN